jgi:hypothetical protein
MLLLDDDAKTFSSWFTCTSKSTAFFDLAGQVQWQGIYLSTGGVKLFMALPAAGEDMYCVVTAWPLSWIRRPFIENKSPISF